MASVLLPSRTSSLRKYSYTPNPPLSPRRHSVQVPPVAVNTTVAQSSAMDSRYYRPSSPRRHVHPGRSSTGTFADPYYEPHYSRAANTSPRTSGERLVGSSTTHPHHYTYAPSSSSGTRSSNITYDSYSGRPRRNTLTESDDRLVRTNASTLAPVTAIPIRTHGLGSHHDRPSSPLARSWDTRGETYVTHAPRREHKRIYSVDDNSHTSKLIAEKDVIEPRRRDAHVAPVHSTTTSGGRSYHHSSKPLARNVDVGDEGFSYTDAAGMYRDTEPAWRSRPRSGSIERTSRPTSMVADSRGPRSSARELGPPPSTRGFDKINSGIARNGSLRDHPTRSSSIERARDAPRYDTYTDAAPARSTSTRHHAPAVHQEPPREHRRDTYSEEYERREREPENRRGYTADRFEDREVTSRGFGIAPGPGNPTLARDPSLDRHPIWPAQEPVRPRQEDYTAPFYSADRAEARMPEVRLPRERDAVPGYDERPREQDRGHSSAVPVAAGVAAATAATYGAAEGLKSRDRDRDRDRERDSERERERERERRREHDERDRRDKPAEERREKGVDERRDRAPPGERLPPAAAAYASTLEADPKIKDRRFDDEERDRRRRRTASSDESSDERPRHYVDRDVAREADRQKEPAAKEVLDPDEEYRRRIQLEAERGGGGSGGREKDRGDPDREKERRRRKDDRDRSRDREGSDDIRSSRGPPSNFTEPPHSRYDDRSRSVLDTDIVQEPDSLTSPATEREREAQRDRERAVQIVTPPKDPQPPPKGILRKPTEKFPEEPEPIREGVAPHKSALKGKDVPPGARWTKIDRRLVNPEALEEAKERFEERMDCVIVLKVLSKQDIQKLADRTREIREAREEEYERRERRDREKRAHRSHRDDEDRDRGYGEYEGEDEDDVGRDRERERDRPRAIESGR
ncbi:hypothetical protein BCR34DRAFT_475030 [Clohesyomyces aquaticus]|uniref:DUF8035 domain-containing protein n=1 Tax=Clohesyomyces aquaticus TaxID=1231657 RepID=A0A1Y2A4J3_9PLEO|nr:hypothetical protein BCR34DRAFT_475030 [Clohesyomyces aquaticus]